MISATKEGNGILSIFSTFLRFRIVSTDLGFFVLINVYVPNEGAGLKRVKVKLDFMKCLRSHLDQLRNEGRSVMIVGDFNVCTTPSDLHKSFRVEERYSEAEIDAFLDLLVNHEDVWRVLHPNECDTFTYFSERHNNRDVNKVRFLSRLF